MCLLTSLKLFFSRTFLQVSPVGEGWKNVSPPPKKIKHLWQKFQPTKKRCCFFFPYGFGICLLSGDSTQKLFLLGHSVLLRSPMKSPEMAFQNPRFNRAIHSRIQKWLPAQVILAVFWENIFTVILRLVWCGWWTWVQMWICIQS